MLGVLRNMFQPDDGLSEMSMEEDLYARKFRKKEEPENLALKIAKISMRYTVKLPDTKKMAYILRLGKVCHAGVLSAKERACCRSDKRSCNSKALLVYMTNVWKMH
jgi:hypothetical protein